MFPWLVDESAKTIRVSVRTHHRLQVQTHFTDAPRIREASSRAQ